MTRPILLTTGIVIASMAAGEPATRRALPAPIFVDDSITFGWGDVFARSSHVLGDHISVAFGLGELSGFDPGWGPQAGYGDGYSFVDEKGDPVYFMVRTRSPWPVNGILWQEIRTVAADSLGAPLWREPTAALFVSRPVSETADPDQYRAGIHRATLDVAGLPVRSVAYGLSPSDVTAGRFNDGHGRLAAYRIVDHEHRVQRTVHAIDLGDPQQEQFIRDTFWPQEVAGLGVDVLDDDNYDVPGFDLERRLLSLFWDEDIAAYPWVGFVASLRDGEGEPADLSAPGLHLTFTLAGWTGSPDGAPYIYVVLEDVHEGTDGLGNEAHLQIDIGEITPIEQRVTLPLARFQEANPALDLGASRHLKFAARDDNLPGSPYCLAGSVGIFDIEFFVASPSRLSPQNVFWSNDPFRDAQPSPTTPLSDEFLGQPTTSFKYFHGVAGPNMAEVDSIVRNVTAIVDAGVTPHVTMEMWPDGEQDVLGDIASGAYDDFFSELFRRFQALEKRIEIAPLHEANGWWYPWSSFGEPTRVSGAFCHIAHLRDEARANNVAICYCVAAVPGNAGALRDAVAAHPGAACVDFVGLQGFESGYSLDVVTFNEIFTTAAGILRVRAPSLPQAITEYGFYTLTGAQYEKGALGGWALGDVVDLRTPVAPVNMIYFNVAKWENGAWRDWRYYDSATGEPVPEMAAYIAGLESLGSEPVLSTDGLGRDAYEVYLRAHRRTVLALERGLVRRAVVPGVD